MNPDWEMILCVSSNKEWDIQKDDQRDFASYKGYNYFDRIVELNVSIENVGYMDGIESKVSAITPIHESDLYRYYKLYNDGGFYSDMDILYFRPIDNFYSQITQSGAGTIIYACKKYAAVGFLGAEKGNPFYIDLLKSVIGWNHNNEWEAYGEMLLYSFFGIKNNPLALIENINKKYKEAKAYNIPKELVYCYDCFDIQSVYDTPVGINKFDPVSIGYHWYGGHQLSKKHNNVLDENNYRNYKITFSEIVKELQEMN